MHGHWLYVQYRRIVLTVYVRAQQFVKDTGEEAIIVEQPKVQGRQMQMILGPKREG